MNYARASDTTFIVRLDPGDDIHASLVTLAEKEAIHNGEVSGIGSVDGLTLAHYRKDHQAFTEKSLDGILEIASLQGNIGLVDGAPLAHLHIVASNESMQAQSGHLVSGTCSATVELIVTKLDSTFRKTITDEIGLKLWELS